MIKAHKVILSAHSVWINNFGECLYQSKKGILEPNGKVWYQPARNTLRDNVEKEGGASAFMMGEEQGLTGSRYPTRPDLFFNYPTRPVPKFENDRVAGN